MGRLLGMLSSLFVYVCVATTIAAGSGFMYMRASGQLDDARLGRILAVAQGIEAPEAKKETPVEKKDDDQEEPSHEDRQVVRDLQSRHLELREQAVKSGLDRVGLERQLLTEERKRYEYLRKDFEDSLKQLREGALTTGHENVRAIWENIKPKQAKEQILKMIEADEINDVVTIFSAIPIAKRAKIVAEFKSPEETKKMDDLLRLIREGVAEVNLIEKTDRQIKQR
jgi:hypothetical protein